MEKTDYLPNKITATIKEEFENKGGRDVFLFPEVVREGNLWVVAVLPSGNSGSVRSFGKANSILLIESESKIGKNTRVDLTKF